MSGCGGKNAGAIARERSESFSGPFVCGKICRGQAKEEGVPAVFWRHLRGRRSDRDFGPEGVCRFVSRPLLGHGFGALPAPGGSLLFCFDSIAWRVTVSARTLVRKVRRQVFSGASVKAELRPWEPGPSLASLGVTRAGRGNSTKRRRNHVPDSYVELGAAFPARFAL